MGRQVQLDEPKLRDRLGKPGLVMAPEAARLDRQREALNCDRGFKAFLGGAEVGKGDFRSLGERDEFEDRLIALACRLPGRVASRDHGSREMFVAGRLPDYVLE